MRTLFTLAFLMLCTHTVMSETVWPLPDQPAVVMNTLSTLQYYGPTTPGFHHGLDLVAPADSIVVAPISGMVETRYYYREQTDYTYEIAISTADGLRWEFHHIDPGTIPAEIEQLADGVGSVTAGTIIGKIYDATEIGIEPHLHINVINGNGLYLNPLAFLPELGDKNAPIIEKTWWAIRSDTGYMEVESPAPGINTLVMSAYDTAPGDFLRQSLYSMQVFNDTEILFDFKFDQLPAASFFDGLDDIYFLDELILLNGDVIRSETKDLRRFLYAADIDINENKIIELRIVAKDFSGNTTRMEYTIP